jgi:hypothetical protein
MPSDYPESTGSPTLHETSTSIQTCIWNQGLNYEDISSNSVVEETNSIKYMKQKVLSAHEVGL